MSDKLFDIPAIPINRTFIFTAYKGNRIAVKLIRLLTDAKIYSVKKAESTTECVTFEISIFTKDSEERAFELLNAEVINYIPDNFPPNYIFYVNNCPLGFVGSFFIRPIDGGKEIQYAHKIKEINKRSVMPSQQIYKRP